MTRGMFVTALGRPADAEPDASGAAVFSDAAEQRKRSNALREPVKKLPEMRRFLGGSRIFPLSASLNYE